ncbi:MAG: phenylacetate--CoA ligase [Candidatus Latescibacteria bacterium]|nr:phenylacetate--CoA ligase [Candidatus Latescibacterota bacterium]
MPKDEYFNEDIETMPKEKLQALQLERLKQMVETVYNRSPFYRRLYDEAGVKPYDIRRLEDIQKLPFLEKRTVREAYPFGMVIAPRNQLLEMHSTSGTTGKPVLVFATQGDIDLWAELNARELWMTGLRPGDSLLNAYGYGLPTGGFGFHYGALKMGVLVIPTGSGQVERQIMLLNDLDVTAFCMTPSFALYVGQRARELGVEFSKKRSLRVGLFGAEPWPWSTRERIEELFGITAYDEFGMTEFLGPGMTCECRERNWMHAWADAFFCECINPETGEWVKDGEEGELVWTWLTAEGTAMVRYRSRDISALTWDDCPCGRSHPRIKAIKGRTDDAVSISGLIVFPSQVEAALVKYPDTGANFRMYIDTDPRGLDRLTLKVEVKDRTLLDNAGRVKELVEDMRESIQNTTGINPKEVELVAPDSLPRVTAGEGKTASARVEDRRKR